MKVAELIQALADELRLGSLAPNADGCYELSFDGNLELELVPAGTSQVILRGRLEKLPAEKDEQEKVCLQYLQRNLAHLRDQDQQLSLDRLGGYFWIHRLVRSDNLDVRQFCGLVEDFLNSLEWWQQQFQEAAVSFSPFNMLRP